MLASRPAASHNRFVTIGAAFVFGVVAFFAGWHARKWRYAESDLRSARSRLAGAMKAAWRARAWWAGAAILVWGIALMWTQGKGR